MIAIGLTGTLAAGKSTVARLFEKTSLRLSTAHLFGKVNLLLLTAHLFERESLRSVAMRTTWPVMALLV